MTHLRWQATCSSVAMRNADGDGNYQNSDDIGVRCGRCGKPLFVKVDHIGNARTIECEPCAAQAPFSSRSVYIVFEWSLSIHLANRLR